MTIINPINVDRLIVHQFDPGRPSPGGIDTCLRGICRYAPSAQVLAVVGVDAGGGGPHRKLGQWEQHVFGDNTIFFLPVVKIDPGNQKRIVPHSLRLALGLLRFRHKMPQSRMVQAHRMDMGLLLSHIMSNRELAYYVHTQENGLTGKTSDSFWRKAAGIHARLERATARRATDVVVFNEEYASAVAEWTPAARFSPTWFDPRLIGNKTAQSTARTICWVGRLEVPKDPGLALSVLEHLNDEEDSWTLEMVGSGTLLAELKARLVDLPARVQERVILHGRLTPEETAGVMQRSNVFLMTSHAGYEGYPRVLVEAMASGLPAVVTHGSDTGGLVSDGITGYVCDRRAKDIAKKIDSAQALDQDAITASVAHLAGPAVVKRLFSGVTQQ